MRVSEPDRDSSPVSEFHIAVITDVSTKVRISSAEIYPSEMETMAESILVSSSSVMVIDESITESPSFSVKVRLPLASDMTGASLTAMRVMVELVDAEASVPSLITQEMVRSEVLGLSEVLL